MMDLKDKKEELAPIAELLDKAMALISVARSDSCPPYAFDRNVADAVAMLETAAKGLCTLRGLR